MYAYILPYDGHGRFHPLVGRPICMMVPVMDMQSMCQHLSDRKTSNEGDKGRESVGWNVCIYPSL